MTTSAGTTANVAGIDQSMDVEDDVEQIKSPYTIQVNLIHLLPYLSRLSALRPSLAGN